MQNLVTTLWMIVNSKGRGVMLKLIRRFNFIFNILEMKVKCSLARGSLFLSPCLFCLE